MSDVTRQVIHAANIFDPDHLADFIASIVEVMPYGGVSMSRFYLCEINGVRFLTKLCFYRKGPKELYGRSVVKRKKSPISHTDAEIRILTVLKNAITSAGISPCVLEIVYAKSYKGVKKIVPSGRDCSLLSLVERPTPGDDFDKLICEYHNLVKEGLAHDKYSFIVLDKCDITLNYFLRRLIDSPVNGAIFKSLLFMIIHVLASILRIYPKFRHYDLHTDNILIKIDPNYKFRAGRPKYLVFKFGKEKFSVPYFGLIPKIIDFGFSVLPEEGIASAVIDDQNQMYLRADNDILYLFYWIQTTVGEGTRIGKLLKTLEPTQSYIAYNAARIRNESRKVPDVVSMMKSTAWHEYQHDIPMSQIYQEFTSA